ncbi:hypothetical protein ACIQNU_02560 [Streptomyces sp. NPDC091292]|uniref:hypothetical protein n=1 Tax=Streptomyces sp. NPDC091292 TaxID=3365991 RepID=UPI00380F3681
MTESISVRVKLDSYNIVRPQEKQTQVVVSIPDVARAFYLLPAGEYEELQDAQWSDALKRAIEYTDEQSRRGGSSVAESLKAARKAVREWLVLDENWDAMNVAWFEDRARRDPVSRSLLKDRERLSAELEQRSRDLADVGADRGRLKARVAELEAQRERRRGRLVALQNDALSMRGVLSPNGEERKVPFALGETLTPAVEWLVARIAELEAASTFVYRAEHPDSGIVLGTYSTRDAAVEHCEALATREGATGLVSWVPDDGDALSPEELTYFDVECCDGDDVPVQECTGYVVTPLEVAAAYDPDGDE